MSVLLSIKLHLIYNACVGLPPSFQGKQLLKYGGGSIVLWLDSGIRIIRQVRQRLSWWRHQIDTFSALLAICAGNSPVPGEFPSQRPVTRSFDVFFDLRPSKHLSKQSWGWWFETTSRPLWCHCNVYIQTVPKWPIFGLLSWWATFVSSHCNSFKDRAFIHLRVPDLQRSHSDFKMIGECRERSPMQQSRNHHSWNYVWILGSRYGVYS